MERIQIQTPCQNVVCCYVHVFLMHLYSMAHTAYSLKRCIYISRLESRVTLVKLYVSQEGICTEKQALEAIKSAIYYQQRMHILSSLCLVCTATQVKMCSDAIMNFLTSVAYSAMNI